MDNENGVAGRIADSMKGELGQVAADAARNAVEANLDAAAATVENRYGAVLDPAADVAEQIGCAVRARPLTAVMLAAVAGFLVAFARSA